MKHRTAATRHAHFAFALVAPLPLVLAVVPSFSATPVVVQADAGAAGAPSRVPQTWRT